MPQSQSPLGYSDSGYGDVVLLLDWTPWKDSGFAASLAVAYRVISIEPPHDDLRGESAGNLAAAVERLARSERLESCSVVGTSLGADVAFALARRGNLSVSAMVLVSPTLVAPNTSAAWDTPVLAVSEMLAHRKIPPSGLPDPVRTANLSAMARRWRDMDCRNPGQVSDMDCALLVVYGQEDRLASRHAGQVWRERVGNCTVCYVYDAGHAVSVDRPEALVSVVTDFLGRRETFIVENQDSMINP